VVTAQNDLKCPRAADQTREPFQRSTARNESDADLGVAEQGALPAGEAHVAGQYELVPDAARAAANLGDAHDWRTRGAAQIRAKGPAPPAVQLPWPRRDGRRKNRDSPTGTLRPSRTGPTRGRSLALPIRRSLWERTC